MTKKPVIAIIIQARVGSTRFPAKVLQSILGKPMLLLMLERVQYSKYGKNIIVAYLIEITWFSCASLMKQHGP